MMRRLAFLGLAALVAAAPCDAALSAVGLDKSNYTSDFAIGSAVVSVIFTESTGEIDPKTEHWTSDRQAQALSKIMAGLDYWSRQNPRSPLTFTLISQTVSTKYEPITHPYYDEGLWIPDVMARIGYTGSRFNSTRAYINSLRTQYQTDWGWVVFVVDSLNDADGKFADGYFAYTYLGGPFTVMTYKNDGYGIANMDVVFAHETGHIFNALDEYAGASGPNDYSNGYFPTINGNHEYSSIATDPDSIMRGGIRWSFDPWMRLMIGWRDSDGNGRDDIVDRPPVITYTSQPSGQAGVELFHGSASVGILPRQNNSQGLGLTVDTIQNVEFRSGNTGDWQGATPVSGTFQNASEGFTFDLTNSNITTQSAGAPDVSVRVLTRYSQIPASGTGGTGFTAASTSLSDAHPFPNPYKPNSGLGHTTGITFVGLTPGARVQVFTPAGDAVYDKKMDAAASSLQWDAVNDDGHILASGVYLYRISDDAGNKKTGKLAIVR